MPRFPLYLLLCCAAAAASLSTLSAGEVPTCSGIVPMSYRSDNISIADFGGVGDGKTLNTKAFKEAIYRIQHLKRGGGGTLLYIPAGEYLTESFNLTSHMTLYLATGAVIKATQVGIHIKTNTGRGGYIRNITVSNVYMEDVRTGIRIAGDVGGHPDGNFNPTALPAVEGLTLDGIWGQRIGQPGLIRGLKDAPFKRVCLSNVNLHVVRRKSGKNNNTLLTWKCSDVSGGSFLVSPSPCSELASSNGATDSCSDHFRNL
ncbi:unnamed protein product [Linum tenue]|uniref:Pectate lyase superfamily protein domain-containing protein n=1 Tax=Linum tenue TaxID=586396 RepID=A0AAV0M5F9_9ROSI|nr:unnamed protein product [Linum tenue]